MTCRYEFGKRDGGNSHKWAVISVIERPASVYTQTWFLIVRGLNVNLVKDDKIRQIQIPYQLNC